MLQGRAGVTWENGKGSPQNLRGPSATPPQARSSIAEGAEVEPLPSGHREVKGLPDMVQSSWYKAPGLPVTEPIFVPADGVTRGDDKIQGGKAARTGENHFSPPQTSTC